MDVASLGPDIPDEKTLDFKSRQIKLTQLLILTHHVNQLCNLDRISKSPESDPSVWNMDEYGLIAESYSPV